MEAFRGAVVICTCLAVARVLYWQLETGLLGRLALELQTAL